MKKGTNTLTGNNIKKIEVWKDINMNGGKKGQIPDLWDGKPLKEYAMLLKLFKIDLSLTKDCSSHSNMC